MHKTTSGFTIVELLVVIAVIGVLSTIGLLSFGRYQIEARDSQRAAKTTVIAEALEKYYDKSGEYPSCPALTGTSASVTTTVLPGLDPTTLLAPKKPTSETNSIKCTDLTGASGEDDVFAYVGDGSAACSSGTACLKWTLKYKEESTNQIISIQSRRNTDIATSGTQTLVASVTGFTSVNLTWGAINNALSYEIERATNNAFTTGLQTTSATAASTSMTVTGLAYNTQYYFRIRAIASDTQGNWSNTASARTWTLTTPSITATTNSSTAFTASWGAVTHAASYTVQCSSNGTTWGSGCSTSVATTSFQFGSAAQGSRYYVRVQAVNGAYTSDWSNIANTITTINAPAAYGLFSDNTLPNWNYLYGRSDAVCPAGTTASFDWYANGSFWVSGTQHRAVNYGLNWNTSVTLQVASRCTTSIATSGFTWANNSASMSLPWPTVVVTLPGDSIMYFSGSCPKWSTSHNYYYDTNGSLNKTGNTTASQYGPDGPWGNGNAHVILSCTGPWGTASIEGTSTYGPGCVPTKTLAACYE